MPKIYQIAIDLPEPNYSAIGELLQRWAQLEYQLHEVIWRAIGLDNKQGRTLTVGMRFETLNGILGTATRRWIQLPRQVQEVRSILKAARAIYRDRNLLAHGSWQQDPDNPKELRLADMWATEQRIMPRAIHRTVAELRTTCQKLRALNVRAQKLISELEQLQPSRSKSA